LREIRCQPQAFKFTLSLVIGIRHCAPPESRK
jgi:hypothetical protein